MSSLAPLLRQKFNTLHSAASRADIVLLADRSGFVAFMRDAETIKRLAPLLVIAKDFGDADELEEAWQIEVSLDKTASLLDALTRTHSVGLVDVMPACDKYKAKYVMFALLKKQHAGPVVDVKPVEPVEDWLD